MGGSRGQQPPPPQQQQGYGGPRYNDPRQQQQPPQNYQSYPGSSGGGGYAEKPSRSGGRQVSLRVEKVTDKSLQSRLIYGNLYVFAFLYH